MICVLFTVLAGVIFIVRWTHLNSSWEPRYPVGPVIATQDLSMDEVLLALF